MKYLSFDIEIATEIPDGVEDWSTLHPMGITRAATWASDDAEARVWYGRDNGGAFSAAMDTEKRFIEESTSLNSQWGNV